MRVGFPGAGDQGYVDEVAKAIGGLLRDGVGAGGTVLRMAVDGRTSGWRARSGIRPPRRVGELPTNAEGVAGPRWRSVLVPVRHPGRLRRLRQGRRMLYCCRSLEIYDVT